MSPQGAPGSPTALSAPRPLPALGMDLPLRPAASNTGSALGRTLFSWSPAHGPASSLLLLQDLPLPAFLLVAFPCWGFSCCFSVGSGLVRGLLHIAPCLLAWVSLHFADLSGRRQAGAGVCTVSRELMPQQGVARGTLLGKGSRGNWNICAVCVSDVREVRPGEQRWCVPRSASAGAVSASYRPGSTSHSVSSWRVRKASVVRSLDLTADEALVGWHQLWMPPAQGHEEHREMGGPGLGQWRAALGAGGMEWGHLRPMPGPQS